MWFVLRNLKTSISKTVLGRFGRDYIGVKKSWVLYDVANLAFVLLVTSVVPTYFHQIAENGSLSESDYLSYWSAAISIVTLLLLFVGPLSDALSDKKGWRKPILMILVAIGAITCFILSSLIDDSYIVPKVLLALFGIGLLFFLLSTRHHVYDVSPSK